jgi:hypothetical protein
MNLRFSLLGLIGLTTLAALASAALVQPGIGWTSVVVSLTVALLGWQVLRAMLTTGQPRAAATGWLLFAIAYLAVVLAPWLGSRIGPQLLTSRALTYAQVNWRHEEPGAGVQTPHWLDWNGRVNINTPIYDGTSSTILLNYDYLTPTPTSMYGPAPDPTASANYFQLSGHWLCAWIAGWLGSLLAVQFHRMGMWSTRSASGHR